MKYSYFPGCTLKNKAKDLDLYARECAKTLGFELEEIEMWQCCGGVFVTSGDEIATKLSSVRALKAAAKENRPLVTVCSACHNVIKQTNHAMKNDKAFADKVNRYMNDEPAYKGEAEVYHYLEILRDKIGFDKIKEKVTNPLKGKKIGGYYGCLMLRPSSVMQMDDAENPQILESLIKALGADPVEYAQKNECCGGYMTLQDAELSKKRSAAVYNNAKACGVELLVTACPLCKYNLIKNGCDIPVVYFTELLAEALGVKEVKE